MDSGLSERENNTLRLSSLMAVPPPPPQVQPLEGLQGTNLPKANLTQWASYVQDMASGMQKPPRMATECPSQDMAGVLHKLENLTGVGFCRLCYTVGSSCRCSRAAPQAPCKVLLLLTIQWSCCFLCGLLFLCNCARGFYCSGYALNFWGML